MSDFFRTKRVGVGVTPSSLRGLALTLGLVAAIWGLRRVTPDQPAVFYVGAAVLVLAYCFIAFRSAANREPHDGAP